MSSRTFCDRCGRECVSGMRRSVAHLTELQFATGHDHPVAEDSYRPVDLCDICTDVIKAAFGDGLKIGHHASIEQESVMVSHGADFDMAVIRSPTLEAREPRIDAPAAHPGEPLPRAEL